MKASSLLLLVGLLFAPVSYAEQTINYPATKPFFSISFPDSWVVEHDDESVSASSKDELANMELIALDAEEIDDAIDIGKESLEDELPGIKFTKPESGELNGMNVTFLNGQVSIEGVKMAVNCCVFAPKKADTFFMLFNIIPLEALEKHGGDIGKILNSVKGK
ncbi:MAG: hypothetical protein R3F13_15610 [Prosthecobacter sp.]